MIGVVTKVRTWKFYLYRLIKKNFSNQFIFRKELWRYAKAKHHGLNYLPLVSFRIFRTGRDVFNLLTYLTHTHTDFSSPYASIENTYLITLPHLHLDHDFSCTKGLKKIFWVFLYTYKKIYSKTFQSRISLIIHA